ncbi:ABC transporter related [Shewanella sediminis HAW-EB3]|uniref:ABC transporter related n=1 Tax=Shewanella sediminis (strain HAW-EB3) TaxID=425104 RepID=A8FXP5_SHESH|nr:ATP-binding cassette domain-containing protein [Shewanella sediminis]ABV37618.1 ABC transporter related [Shewanella sediminis HAW-EB3]
MNNSAILSVRNLTLEYQTRSGFLKLFTHKAIDNVSFEVQKGEVFGVLGRNGSGKSSLLKVLAGTIQPDSGEVICPPNTTRSLLALGLGFNNNLSGRDNALISCLLNGYSKQESQPIIEQVKAFAELGKFFEQPVKTYSAGMRSRLGFATAIFTQVDIMLIDETLSVGDSAFKLKAETALKEKITNNEQTIIFVSHSIQQIKKLCQRCLWLEKGVAKQLGTTDSVMENYLADKQETVKI